MFECIARSNIPPASKPSQNPQLSQGDRWGALKIFSPAKGLPTLSKVRPPTQRDSSLRSDGVTLFRYRDFSHVSLLFSVSLFARNQ